MSLNYWLIFGAIGTYLLGLISGYVNRIYQLCFVTIRIPRQNVYQIYTYLSSDYLFRFAFEESLSVNINTKLPDVESSLIVKNGIPVFLDVSEKYLTAGWTSKEEIVHVTTLRWYKNKFKKLFTEATNKIERRSYIKVYINQYGYFRESNQLNKVKFKNSVKLDKNIDRQLNDIIADFKSGKREKSGILLYGLPGNGKTSIIKTIGCKNDLDIYIPIIRSSMTNDEIVNMFANIPTEEEAIIVLEDFDAIFEGRKPLYNDCKFSFDVFLNVLDGLYLNLDHKIIFMTANNIDKVDKALKNRPSRFDYVMEIGNPSFESRLGILSKYSHGEHTSEIARLTEGKSAAIVNEIGRRKLNYAALAESIEEITSSFLEEEQQNALLKEQQNLPKEPEKPIVINGTEYVKGESK